jgi:transposase-like protein
VVVYTDKQKTEAVKLYLEVGPDEAAKTIGCSRRQVYRWLGSHGVSPKKPDEQRAETEARHAQKREELRDLLLDQAVDMLHRMNEMHIEYREVDGQPEQVVHLKAAPADCKSYALAAAVLIDKMRLENGEVTGRQESIHLGLVESEIRRLEAEVGTVPTPRHP